MPESSHPRLAALDGLRAIAVGAVLLFHLRIPGCSLGWSGVNLFFVLSGFLITRLLLDTPRGPGWFRTFYLRRALRIFPIYYLTLLLVAGWAIVRAQPIADLPYYLTYTQNYRLGILGFRPHFPIAMNHTWSLAIEEQFYLAWPLLVYSLQRRALVRLLQLFILAGPCARALAIALHWGPYLYFTSLPAQLDSIAIGGLLATSLWGSRAAAPGSRTCYLLLGLGGGAAAAVAATMGLQSYWSPPEWTPHLINDAVLVFLSLAFAGMLGLALDPTSRVSRVLSIPPLRHLGRISYAIYLFHFPVFVLLDHVTTRPHGESPSLAFRVELILAKLALTYTFACVSWWLVEAPSNRLRIRLAPLGASGSDAASHAQGGTTDAVR